MSKVTGPKQILSMIDALSFILGIVIGVGIFKTPALVAASTGDERIFILAWALGGAISVIGALCYAELATSYPHAGGEYHYLFQAFGRHLAFLFAWARMTVIQPGAIAGLAFVSGDYISQLYAIGEHSSFLYAVFAVLAFTIINLRGVQKGRLTQNFLTAVKVIGVSSVALVGILLASPQQTELSAQPVSYGVFALAMIFVLWTFGGWNEAAYLSAELLEVRRNMVRALIWGIGIITVIYLLINVGYLRGLGLKEMSQSEVVAADLFKKILGEGWSKFICLLIAFSAWGAINASIFTGARANFALGKDFAILAFMGRWDERRNSPVNALLIQTAISSALLVLGTFTRQGFVTMVEYTAPIFWFFFMLTGMSLFILRKKRPANTSAYRVPFYPLTPLFFCLICFYLLQASLVETGVGALVGVAVLGVGVIFLLVAWGLEKIKKEKQP